MSVGDTLKETYFNWEEKWYNSLDKIDEHIPIYKVIDKVDNVVPSFALLLILIFILILLLLIGTFGLVVTQDATLKLTVVDAAGNGISAASIEVEGIDETFYSNNLGLVQDIAVPGGYTISVKATKGDKEKIASFRINSAEVVEEIILPVDAISFDSKTLQFVNETGALITSELNLSYTCSSGADAPADEQIFDGTTNVSSASNCGSLLLTVTSPNYETRSTTITNASTTITLTESAPSASGRAVVTLTYNDEVISESVRVSAYKASNSYIPEETIESVNGVASFDLPVGDYRFETKQEQGYVTNTSEVVNVSEFSEATTTIELSKSILGQINVIVKRGNTELEDVLVTLKKGISALDNETTDTDGNVSFEVAQDGPFTIVATKEDYCQKAVSAELGDTVEIKMERDNGSCGGELKIKVVDQDGKPIRYARAMIFGENSEDEYKLGYKIITTDFNGEASWDPVNYSGEDEKYKVFAYKGTYSGWSAPREFTSFNENEEYVVNLELDEGLVNIIVNDNDGDALQFAEVQLFEDIGNTSITGKRIIQDNTGTISFNVSAGQRVYAVIEKEDYESYMTIPKYVIGNGTINFEVTLSRPPIEELLVDFVGLYKNEKKVLKAQPGEEYLAVFELTAPVDYDELGFFVRVGEETVSKTEMDKMYIKELVVPGKHDMIKGASFNPPKGYNIDEDYLNLEESKWAQSIWDQYDYKIGKIRVGAIIKIKENARLEDLLEIGYRAWGEDNGYERDPVDSVLGTTESNSSKSALYAATKKAYLWIGTETLCETQGENSFCVSATYTDPDGIKNTFDSSFDAKNNTEYILGIKVSNASPLNFENTSTEIDNIEDNLLIGEYSLISPSNSLSSGSVDDYETDWISLGAFRRDTEFSFSSLEMTPQKTGYGSLLLRLRDTDSILFEKTFGVNVASDKKMSVEYLVDSEYVDTMPSIASGKRQSLTIRAINNANGLEINDAYVKLYDRFGSKVYETQTNKLGLATIEIPASLPDELLKISVEKSEYETYEIEFRISENIVNVEPETLSFTVNPQTKEQDTKTVKVSNETGFDLEIKDIYFDGKTKGLISESRMDSWFASYIGTDILANDYEELEFAVISAAVVPTAGDIEGTFVITVGNDIYSWVQEIDTKIRVGLGNDVDDPSCLEITKTNWKDETQGEEIEISFEVKNNCTVEGTPVPLRNLGAKIEPATNQTGKFSAQSTSAYTEISRGYARTFRPTVNPDEVVPVTLKFTPYGGTNGNTNGTITFEAKNRADSTDQLLTIELEYDLTILDSSCLVIGSDLVSIAPEESGSFSVTNNCPTSATFSIKSDLPISNSTFSLAEGETQEVTIQRNAGDIPGAYNNLVNARLGGGKQELIGNVKAILESDPDSCFTMTRFEFDVYDSPYSDFDGVDRGYVHNNCTQKVVPTQVYGEEDFDWDKVLRDMLVGAVAGGLTSGKLTPWDDKIGAWFNKDEKNKEKAADEAYKEMEKQVREGAAKNVKVLENSFYTVSAKKDQLKDALEEVATTEGNNPEVVKRAKAEVVKLEAAEKRLDAAIDEAVETVTDAADDASKEVRITREQEKEKARNGQLNNEDAEETAQETEERVEAIANRENEDVVEEVEEAQQIFIKQIDETSQSLSDIFETTDGYEIGKKINGNMNFPGDDYDSEIILVLISPSRQNSTIKTLEIKDYYLLYQEDETFLGRIYQDDPLAQKFIDGTEITEESTAEFRLETTTRTSNTKIVVNPETGYSIENEETLEPINAVGPYASDESEDEINSEIDNGPSTTNLEEALFKNYFPPTNPGSKTKFTYNNKEYYLSVSLNRKVIRVYDNDEKRIETTPFNGPRDVSGILGIIDPNANITSRFLLAAPRQTNSGGFNLSNALTYNLMNAATGSMGGSALGGAMLTGALSILMGQDNVIEYSESFAVPLVEILSIDLSSDAGIGMSVGEATYDYDQYYQNLAYSGTGSSYYNGPQNQQGYSANNNSGQGLTNRNISGYVFNPQALTATQGLVEIRELEFTNSGGAVNENPFEPFVGIITVTGEEKVYESEYEYDDILEAAKKRGDYDDDKGNFFEEIIDPTPTQWASITEDDLVVKETRNYEKKFHVLFNSYEYVECGPDTYPCTPGAIGNCTVGSKTGSTGSQAVPKLLLDWDYADIDADECDESNPRYSYCDVTQATISTFKKLNYLKDFFTSNSLNECPSAIDVAGTKSQELNGNEIDVAITNIKMSQVNDKTEIEVIVRTNNAQELGAEVNIEIRDKDSDSLVDTYSENKDFTSAATYTFEVDDDIVTTGQYNVIATLDLDLCNDCENNDTTNDEIRSTLIMGASGAQECQAYDTRKDYFEDVLAANNINDAQALEYVNFTINLTRDSFSNDFKEDLDSYLMQVASAPTGYTDNIRELFISDQDKFEIEWDNSPGAWRAGKYNARLIIEFNNETWQWQDNNDIKKITLDLEYFGEPYPYNPIYNVSFNGIVGLSSDNGRQGYGVNYTQKSEEAFTIVEGANAVSATPNPLSNAPTEVDVEVDDLFYNINFVNTGNILTVNRVGENVDLILSPSIAVPVILDITRDQALDAYAYYSVEAGGQPQKTGSRFINWTGIGQGCVDHNGASMTTWVNSPDSKNDSGSGYGLRWNNAVASGTSSFYGVFYVPESTSAIMKIMNQSENANLISNQGSGQQIVVDSGVGIRSLKDVFDRVRNNEVCIIGGEYFWNNKEVLNDIEGEILSRENTCMTIS